MMLEPLPVQSMLKDYGLKPQKGLGQNFLVDDTYLQKIVRAADVSRADVILEVGAGLGSLTRYLATAAGEVISVEIDRKLYSALKKVVKPYKNVCLVQGDIMEILPGDLVAKEGYKVVANIPYYLTSNLIRRLLEATVRPSLVVLTVQKEVAQRICAVPGNFSLLALGVQIYGKPSIAFQIPKGAFFPVPKVDSATLLVDLYPEPLIPIDRLGPFFLLAKTAFNQKRKMLHNSLAGAPALGHEQSLELLNKAGIPPDRRAQTLSIAEWIAMTEQYATMLQI